MDLDENPAVVSGSDDEYAEEDDEVSKMSTGDKLRQLGLTIRILDNHSIYPEAVRVKLSQTKRQISAQYISSCNQSIIREWFK